MGSWWAVRGELFGLLVRVVRVVVVVVAMVTMVRVVVIQMS